ncbi:UDP-2,4-diacetamido-2,4,6-trideoxy-beta-L-altropyranose hydrolase [Phenylobacterium sp. 20VBR1]|uniref:UDP-2,4-diacetamido-2,4, 6-trideoxy-beta-L-altropyranose hydrolase n=1 Tax=Phenylobacterium glaciei TaxID=2803784 RepID=A0A941D3J9_9CAUL|nr:UDP-2,4-diacetamido-2,4,6-trideoxy-beta-L-altropyranose hydrolase [Phenylobacterium glaciei]MBR7620699.1 UDP-2,4-diacetamido-2,4,6-trideoxy-beta-L-altropyranose hydrolase [Phenylobacterium glaciei]
MIPQRPRILFVANAGPEVGGGHVMRCITLARALGERGADCAFACTPEVAALLDVFGPEIVREEATGLDPDHIADALTGVRFDAVVFDHYGLAREHHEALAKGRTTLVIDDLADRPLAANLVLDSGPGRQASDYALFTDAQLLLGPEFAPVRPEFAHVRSAALSRRTGQVRRVLVSLGLTDLGGITARVVERLRMRLSDVALDVVLGAGAPSLPGLTKVAGRDPRLTIHVDSQDMANLILTADIAIGAAGSSVWERCVLGLPSAILVLAQNQQGAAAALAEREAALVVDAGADNLDARLDRAIVRLLTDAPLRQKLSAASAAICDGLGAGRAAEAFLKLIAARDSLPHPQPPQP